MTLPDIAVLLSKKGFNQQLTWGDNVYLTSQKDYLRFVGQPIRDEYVLVPSLATLINKLSDLNYSLHHIITDGSEKWSVLYAEEIIEDENIWVVLSKLWILTKGI